MLKEAQKPKYFMDGLFSKITGQYPYDNPANYCDIQRSFLVYLFASIPAIEDLKLSVLFRHKLDEIEEKDFVSEIKTDNTFRALAASNKQSESDYKRKMAEDLKIEAIIKLYKEYDMKIPDEIKLKYKLKKPKKQEPVRLSPGYDPKKIEQMLGLKRNGNE